MGPTTGWEYWSLLQAFAGSLGSKVFPNLQSGVLAPLISVEWLHVCPPFVLREKKIGASQKLSWFGPQVKSKRVHVTYRLPLWELPGEVSTAICSLSSDRPGLAKLVRMGTALASIGGLNGEHPPLPGECSAEPRRHEFDFQTNSPSNASWAKSAPRAT